VSRHDAVHRDGPRAAGRRADNDPDERPRVDEKLLGQGGVLIEATIRARVAVPISTRSRARSTS
jgi:hypothetical protein